MMSSLSHLASRLDNSYMRSLHPDPQESKFSPNRVSREVHSGHYVRVAPTPLISPYMVVYSEELAHILGLTKEDCESPEFLRTFSGDLEGGIPGFGPLGWATPYALSIYGEEVEPSGAGPKGNGYGDGRAISIGEVPGGEGVGRWELQLKGGGRTPFSRGADGAAVLRSSVREFLASEAMAAMRVPTTRSLSLIATASQSILRPWYSQGTCSRKHGGDVMVENRRAVTTRVAPTFLRVGQVRRKLSLSLPLPPCVACSFPSLTHTHTPARAHTHTHTHTLSTV